MLWAEFGIAPVAWWNDDLAELSDDVSLEECLCQAAEAGFTGMETGRRFPTDMGQLGPILDRHGIPVCGGWFSGRLLDGDIETKKDRIRARMHFFIAAEAPCIVHGETAPSIQGDRSRLLATKPRLGGGEMKARGARMTEFAEWCADRGMPIVYHYQMVAAVETEPEIDAFMDATGEAVKPLQDTRHLHMAGGDVPRAPSDHDRRFGRLHAKDVRQAVPDGFDRARDGFLGAVVGGVFTVPGDGDLPFESIVRRLADFGCRRWFVVGAEQGPRPNPPRAMAMAGRTELSRVLSAAHHEVAG